MEQNLLNRALKQVKIYRSLESRKSHLEVSLIETNKVMAKLLEVQSLLERTTVAEQQARPLISASAIKQCEALANSAISSIFNFPYTVEWDVESKRFVLNKGDYKTDLAEAEGGGISTVISFCFEVYVLVKLGKRRFLAYDESFTQVSDAYFPAFVGFIRTLCHDLNCDILLVSHDQRISPEDVDRVYLVENGVTKCLKA